MRIINSPRLWDNRTKRWHKHVSRTAGLLVVVLSFVMVAGVLSFELSASATNSQHVQFEESTAVLASRDPLPEFGQISPEHDDLGDLLMHKLATPPPQPAPDCVTVPCVALTFDDGPNSTSTAAILDILAQEDVPATFYVVGNKVAANTALIQRMSQEGDEIGNHSWSHANFSRLSAGQISQQISSTQAAVVAAGAPAPKTFRAPYGSINAYIKSQINLPVVLCNVDPKDWAQTDPNKIVELVVSQAKPGAIILLHDQVVTANAVLKIVQDLKTKYNLVTVDYLLGITDGTQGVFYGR